jgi:hypothetical protein
VQSYNFVLFLLSSFYNGRRQRDAESVLASRRGTSAIEPSTAADQDIWDFCGCKCATSKIAEASGRGPSVRYWEQAKIRLAAVLYR